MSLSLPMGVAGGFVPFQTSRPVHPRLVPPSDFDGRGQDRLPSHLTFLES